MKWTKIPTAQIKSICMHRMSYRAHDSIPLLWLTNPNRYVKTVCPCPMFVRTRKIDNSWNPSRLSQMWRNKIDTTIQLNRFVNAINYQFDEIRKTSTTLLRAILLMLLKHSVGFFFCVHKQNIKYDATTTFMLRSLNDTAKG